MSNNTSTLIQTFKTSESIEAGMAVAYNPAYPSYEPRVHRALADELIVGVAKSTSDINDVFTIEALTPGNSFDVLVGEDVAVGDELGLKPVSASSGEAGVFYTLTSGAISSKIVAMESAKEGEKCKAVCFTCPTLAAQASSLDVGGKYVGGPDKHMYFLPTGVPVNSSVSIGNDSTPIYMAGGKFKACTSAGGSAPDFYEVDVTVPGSGSWTQTFGTGSNQVVLTYRLYTSGVEGLQLNYKLADDSVATIVTGVMQQPLGGDAQVPCPDIPLVFKATSTSDTTIKFPKPAYATGDNIIKKFHLMITLQAA